MLLITAIIYSILTLCSVVFLTYLSIAYYDTPSGFHRRKELIEILFIGLIWPLLVVIMIYIKIETIVKTQRTKKVTKLLARINYDLNRLHELSLTQLKNIQKNSHNNDDIDSTRIGKKIEAEILRKVVEMTLL